MFGFRPLASATAASDTPGWRHAQTMGTGNEAV
jgi:hypothetical protein